MPASPAEDHRAADPLTAEPFSADPLADGGPLSPTDLADSLEADLLEGRLAPGARLPSERQLAAQFGIGRPAVRETLRQLEARGLISVQPGRGSFVRRVVPTRGSGSVDLLVRRGDVTARHLVVARRMLESQTARLAAALATPAQHRELRGLVEAFDAALAGGDLHGAASYDIRLHEAIAVASGNPLLQMMFGAIHDFVHATMLRSLVDPGVRAAGAPLHADIVEAIVAGDGDAAAQAMGEHIDLALHLYGHDIDESLATILQRLAARGVLSLGRPSPAGRGAPGAP